MDSNKICFITCVNDEAMYKETLLYIKSLNIPEGIKVETLAIRNASSITSGYNEALAKTDAKYKVYLHQDVFIINKDFINDILGIFGTNSDIGMVGMTGSRIIPTSGCWWEAKECCGQVYESHRGEMNILKFQNVDENIEDVQAIDGFMMITQYDIKWREDIFDGWHFYDASMSVEFLKNNYRVIVPPQEKPWCIHDCGTVRIADDYKKYQDIFIKEYSEILFPLVSIMITAYNRPEYFKIALESALKQSYKNIEIVICDNSTNNSVREVVKEYLSNKLIRYYKNEKALDVIDNFDKVIGLTKGKYISFLMDDDIYHKDKLKVMMNYFIQDSSLALVTSHRQGIDKSGNELASVNEIQKLFYKPTYISESDLKKLFIETRTNYIGEATTPLFKKDYLENGMFGCYKGRRYFAISDMATWIKMSEDGRILYLPETLSYYRIRLDSNQKKTLTNYREMLEAVALSQKIIENEYPYHFKQLDKTYYNLLDVFRNSFVEFAKSTKLLDLVYKNNILQIYLDTLNNLLKYSKKSHRIKDVFIRYYFNLLIDMILKYCTISSNYENISLSKEDVKVINSMLGESYFIDYIMKLYNYKDGSYKEYVQNKIEKENNSVKYIAFYLPQFHSIPENDEWWGKGFTEWTNVTRAMPMYVGHYQPHLPGELGFYNLEDTKTMRKQIELAKNYGIYGFCFYYYWFNGKKLLEKPLENLYQNKNMDFPYCICWANENWTRRWDGEENSILIGQEHSPENDVAFINDIIKYFKDDRYIKVGEKPVLIIYRADIIPNIKNTVNIWREICRKNGIGELFIIGAKTFGFISPDEYGLDAEVEFPPHGLINYNAKVDGFTTINRDYTGQFFDYKQLVEEKEYLTESEYRTFKTAFPSWDNTSRKPNSSFIFHGSTPELYKEWLSDITKYTIEHLPLKERFVFINAWNEWAEGAHLEPDRRYGYAYLDATYKVFKSYNKM